MATKKPLALYSGKVKELQSGDDMGYKKVISRVKMARETVTSSTTLQDDDDFVFPVEANKSYIITGNLTGASANSSGGFKWGFSLPSGASGRINVNANGNNVGGNDADVTVGGSAAITIQVNSYFFIRGYLNVGESSGNIVLRWAQHAGYTTSTWLERGSIMTLTEI